MRKNILTLLALTLSTIAIAQDRPGLGLGGKKISKAAMLDIQATNKGVLIPRIDLKESTVLNGGKNPEGVIVYNNGTTLAHGFYYWTGTAWEQVAGNTQVTEQINEIDNKFTTEIKNITNIIGEGGEATDISYLVSYNPGSKVFTYLVAKEDGSGGYNKKEIDFKTATKEAETNTFMREVSTGEGVDKVISSYIYFSENAITEWLDKNEGKDPVKEMPNDLGTKVDVLGVVNNNFKEIFNNETNTETINNIIKNAPDNVWVEERDVDGKKEMFLVYTDKNKEIQVVPLTQNETQTSMFKHSVKEKGKPGEETPTEILDVNALEEGAIYYSYKGEHGKTFYINMTSDIITSIHNNTELKEEIFNTVNNFTTEGGNVFYGPLVEGGKDNVLYIIDDKKEKQQLDISKDIIKVLEETTNNIVVETILKQTEVKVKVNSVDVAVGTTIDNAKVYKGKRLISVYNQEDEYDVTFTGKITANPSKKVKKEGDTDFSYESTEEKIETLLSATIINLKNKQVVVNSVTDVEVNSNNELNFYFGSNGMYMALENGDYEVVFEYTAK